jgi:hypothetical protein
MNCEVDWIRVTDGKQWATQRTSSVRHYNAPDTMIKSGQRLRKRPDDFDIIKAIIPEVGKLMDYYNAGHGTVVRWIQQT